MSNTPENNENKPGLGVDELLDAIEEAVRAPQTNQNAEEKELTVEQLTELIKSKGPNGITFPKAVARRKRAIKTMERFYNAENVSEAEARIFTTAKEIAEDKELEDYIDTQIRYRNCLGIKPQTKEDNDARHVANEEKKKQPNLRHESASKRKLSNPTSNDPKKQATAKPGTSKDAKKEAKGDTTSKAKLDNDAMRMVLVDTSGEDGKISEEIRTEVEIQILTRQVEMANCAELYCESGWKQGYRIFDCTNQATMDFLKDTVKDLNINQGRVKVIPFNELYTVKQPSGWVWVIKPYLPPELVLKLLKSQNPDYNTANWTIKTSGVKKPAGQHFLVKMTREDLVRLKNNKMQLRVGHFTSNVTMDGEDPGKTVAEKTKCD